MKNLLNYKSLIVLALTSMFTACDSSDNDTPSPSGSTWEDYYEAFSNDQLSFSYNGEVYEDARVVVNGVAEEVVTVSPRNIIFGFENVAIQSTATLVDSAYVLEGNNSTEDYLMELTGVIDADEKLTMNLSYEILDEIVGEWEIPSGLRSDAAEFTAESDYDEFEFLGDTLNLSTLESTVNVVLEQLVKRYVKSLSFDQNGIWNVVYIGRENQEGSLPDSLMLYATTNDTVYLGVDFTKVSELDEAQGESLNAFLGLLLQGLSMTKEVDESSLNLTLERETLLKILVLMETVLNTLHDSGTEINELLLQVVADLNTIIYSCSEFDITVKLQR